MLPLPCKVTAQQLPSAVIWLPEPLTSSVPLLQSRVWTRPMPWMWVLSPGTEAPTTALSAHCRKYGLQIAPGCAYALGLPTANASGNAKAHAATDRLTALDIMGDTVRLRHSMLAGFA